MCTIPESIDLALFPSLRGLLERDRFQLRLPDRPEQKPYDAESIFRKLLDYFRKFKQDHDYDLRVRPPSDFEQYLTVLWESWKHTWKHAIKENRDGWETDPFVRGVFLTQAVHRQDAKAFRAISTGWTQELAALLYKEGWSWNRAGQYANVEDCVRDFYSYLSESRQWAIFMGHTRLGEWLRIYLRSFVKTQLRHGIFDKDDDAKNRDKGGTPRDAEEPARKKCSRDKRFLSFPIEMDVEKNLHLPEDQLTMKEILHCAQIAFSLLPPKDQAFLCFYLKKKGEGMTQDSMCRKLDIKPYKLTRIKQRALEQYRNVLNTYLRDAFSLESNPLNPREIEELIARAIMSEVQEKKEA